MKARTTWVPTKVLPMRWNYGAYERIVEPGRHVYRTTMSAGRWVSAFIDTGGVAVVVWLGLLTRTALLPHYVLGSVLLCVIWLLAFGILVRMLLDLLGHTVFQIAPGQVSIRQKRLFRWGPEISTGIAGFAAATLEQVDHPTLMPSHYTPEYMPVLFIESTVEMVSAKALEAAWLSPARPPNATGTTSKFVMGETFMSLPYAEEFVRDINESVELARGAPEAFNAGATTREQPQRL